MDRYLALLKNQHVRYKALGKSEEMKRMTKEFKRYHETARENRSRQDQH